METVKALSIRQPWGWWIVNGSKRIENRSKPTNYRGTIYLHASKWPGLASYSQAVLEMLNRFGTNTTLPDPPHPTDKGKAPPSLPLGGFFATARIVGCLPETDPSVEHDPWTQGPWCWLLADVHAIPFVPYKGQLGLFDVPAAAVRSIAV